ncbi:Ig-like domain-containing protein, partial [Cellulomonas denverensis]
PETGEPIPGEWTDNGDGNWTFVPETPLTEGDKAEVVVTDPAGNESDPVGVVVDTTAPDAPVVPPTQGEKVEVEGVEEGATPSIVDPETGEPIPGEWTDNGGGSWTFTPETPLTEGDKAEVVVTDPAGNESDPVGVEIDTTAPDAPVLNPSNGSSVSGTAEPGSTVTLTDPTGTVLCTVTADRISGVFGCEFEPALADGLVVTGVATDAAGNVSDPASVVVDTSRPAPPALNPSNGSTISGTTVPGATVELTRVVTGEKLGTVVADEKGAFSVPFDPALVDGTVVGAIAIVATGNMSDQSMVVVDRVAPDAPVLKPSNGTHVSGSAEPASTVTLTGPDGAVLGTVVADATTGEFRVPFDPALPDGLVVTAVATDAAGNVSDPASVTVDAVAPEPPVVDETEGDKVTGCAEPGSTVNVYDSEGNLIGTGTAGEDCRFEIVLDPPQGPGSEIEVEVVDESGNVSERVRVTVKRQVVVTLSKDEVTAGDDLVVTATGLAGNEAAEIWLHSTPVRVAEVTTSADGTVQATITIPVNAAAGDHQVVVNGLESKAEGSAPLRVVAPVVPPVVVGSLAITGSELVMGLAGVTALLLTGGLLLALRRRQQKEEQA